MPSQSWTDRSLYVPSKLGSARLGAEAGDLCSPVLLLSMRPFLQEPDRASVAGQVEVIKLLTKRPAISTGGGLFRTR
jgi:hypothetical protein